MIVRDEIRRWESKREGISVSWAPDPDHERQVEVAAVTRFFLEQGEEMYLDAESLGKILAYIDELEQLLDDHLND